MTIVSSSADESIMPVSPLVFVLLFGLFFEHLDGRTTRGEQRTGSSLIDSLYHNYRSDFHNWQHNWLYGDHFLPCHFHFPEALAWLRVFVPVYVCVPGLRGQKYFVMNYIDRFLIFLRKLGWPRLWADVEKSLASGS